jgi:hypothetical protein
MPTNLAAATFSETRIDLSWNDNSDEAGFQILRRLGSGAYAIVGTTGSNEDTFSDGTAAAGQTYTYRVRAFAGSSTSAESSEVGVTTVRPGIPSLVAPIGCVATTEPLLQWGAVPYATHYRIGLWNDDTDEEIYYGDAYGTQYEQPALPPGDYRWKVKGQNGGLDGTFSSIGYFSAGCAPSRISVSPASVSEGNSSTTLMFPVTLDVASAFTVSASLQTSDGTASAGVDYASASPTVTFAPGETAKLVAVTVHGDTTEESDETLFLTITSATGATIGTATGQGIIVNDDPPTLSVGDVAVVEGTGGSTTASFTITRSSPSAMVSTVAYATGPWTGHSTGIATAGVVYTSVSGVVTFAAGSTSRVVAVSIVPDAVAEDHERFVLTLSSPGNAILADPEGVMTIVGDDVSPWALKGAGDFDSDGKPDIVWRYPPDSSPASGQNWVWHMDGVTRLNTVQTSHLMNNSNEVLSGVADADANGKADIWWRNLVDRKIVLWTMNDTQRTNSLYTTPDGSTLSDYSLVGVFDVGNGLYGPGPTPDTSPSAVATYDQKADFVWRHNTSGALVSWYMNGYARYNGIGETQEGLADLQWKLVGAGDFNADGRNDFVWQHGTTRKVVIWFMNGFRRLVNGDPACFDDGSGLTKCARNTVPDQEDASEWNIMGVGDFNNDGKPDLLWRHYLSGHNAVWHMNGPMRIGSARVNLTPNPFN